MAERFTATAAGTGWQHFAHPLLSNFPLLNVSVFAVDGGIAALSCRLFAFYVRPRQRLIYEPHRPHIHSSGNERAKVNNSLDRHQSSEINISDACC